MHEAPAVPARKRPRRGAPVSRQRPVPPDSWNFESVTAVELVAPDEHCAALLLDHAAPYFPAELVSDSESAWVVRFHPPPFGRDWVIELLTVVEHWLESAPLPCAKLVHGDRNYLIRASPGVAQLAADAASALALVPAAGGRS
jgi:hypothetical protein